MKPWRHGWIFAAAWLFYLDENLTALWHHPGGWARTVGLAALTGFAGAYLGGVALLRRIRLSGRDATGRVSVGGRDITGTAWLVLLAQLALFALQVPAAGFHALPCVTYIAATAAMALPISQGGPFVVAVVIGTELLSRLMPGWEDNGYGLAALLGGLASYGIRLAAERQRRLADTQQELADLAVQTERNRIARDLHDILGHSLTVVTVKAELAQRLLDVDVEKARSELRDLEVLARDALADVRSTALGVRGISLPGEIAAAREALTAANVDADLPGAADEVPTPLRELFAWTIREAVTNIVRHAHAARAEVRLGPASVEILDDGAGLSGNIDGGQGLEGLRRRAEQHGGTLTVGARTDKPGFRVRVEVPS
ncbi:sensor histidine kinase [Actinoplanes sp. NBRC 103695]|uniref:sensor histidine kinase n=1 Tax=Actinoplanes sp. NBRC 103695 TaxID=3032202 RepID=UPI0024A1CAE7|nr:sensor histidine kinase [Actinoplanes sp. NBRC 103695]GLY95138.1 histidine kinase [Actinoplanes sp. NBRC 103695]